jgi:NADP-dependent 3-hydroxy acid dehydrogenase YdfG
MAPANSGWKTAWITGASSGIGLELARLLDSKVNHLGVSARSQDKLNSLAAHCRTIVTYPLDVTDADAVGAFADQVDASSRAFNALLEAKGFYQQDITGFY